MLYLAQRGLLKILSGLMGGIMKLYKLLGIDLGF